MTMSRWSVWLLVALFVSLPLSGETWYVRKDGGTRYSERAKTGQCDGKTDAPYRGKGTNQHCAFSDYRYLWDDQTYNNDAWVIAGGDTVIIRNGPWRVGWDAATGKGAGYTWCAGGGTPAAAIRPSPPARPRSTPVSSVKTTQTAAATKPIDPN